MTDKGEWRRCWRPCRSQWQRQSSQRHHGRSQKRQDRLRSAPKRLLRQCHSSLARVARCLEREVFGCEEAFDGEHVTNVVIVTVQVEAKEKYIHSHESLNAVRRAMTSEKEQQRAKNGAPPPCPRDHKGQADEHVGVVIRGEGRFHRRREAGKGIRL